MNVVNDIYHLSRSHPIIFYDGICFLCDGFIQLLLKNDPSGRFKLCMLQSEKGIQIRQSLNLPVDEITTVVAIHNNKVFTGSPWRSLTHTHILRLKSNFEEKVNVYNHERFFFWRDLLGRRENNENLLSSNMHRKEGERNKFENFYRN